ncbi:Dynein assembly factor 4, axonemal [Kappamyces sp. JEL0829]|nr:Dynein assembly factor 4, axonemal [Kappamyces sp. JEL0829]
MPIVIKDYTVSDHQDKVYLSVPLFNVHPSKVDIYSSDVYVRANYPPYFFELDLAHPVDSLGSSCSVGNNEILFELKKLQPAEWAEAAYQQADRLERRRLGDQEALKAQEALKEKRLLEKREKERELVRQQIEVERQARESVAQLKEQEIQTAKDHIAAWSKDLGAAKTADTPRQDSGIFVEKDVWDGPKLEEIAEAPTQPSPAITFDDESSDDDVDLDAIRAAVKQQLKLPEHAPPRRSNTATVKVTFTGRGSIPTQTARETEDAKWMTRIKIAKAMNALKGGQVAKEIEETGQSAREAREKGTSFFKLGNFESAINAFTQALAIDTQDVVSMSNRAACFLKLGQGAECVSDCTLGLTTIQREEDIIKDEVKRDDGQSATRLKQKQKLLARRGAALVNLIGDIEAGARDYEAALALDPDNEGLRLDLDRVKTLLQPAEPLSTTVSV